MIHRRRRRQEVVNFYWNQTAELYQADCGCLALPSAQHETVPEILRCDHHQRGSMQRIDDDA